MKEGEIKALYSTETLTYSPQKEIHLGQTMPNHDSVARAHSIMSALGQAGFVDIHISSVAGMPWIEQVHSADYLRFLRSTSNMSPGQEILPSFFPWTPDYIATIGEDEPGYYAYDTYTPVSRDTYRSSVASANCAVAGAQLLLEGEKSAYVLTRPPGHHALKDKMGGYCYFNNTAIAAQYLFDHGMRRVAILDIDAHHGNGTQQWAWDRPNVIFASIHGNPDANIYPYASGRADELGADPQNRNIYNFPLQPGVGERQYHNKVVRAIEAIKQFHPEVLLVSAGFDTHRDDPFKIFDLCTPYYQILGMKISKLGIPTLHIQEGGYNTETLGENVVAYLKGVTAKSGAEI